MAKYVALYCRLSPRPDGSYEGVPLQEKWGRDYAASAWPDLPVQVFSDEGISAANGDHRPGFEKLRTALAAGEITHVWCVEQSRLQRTEIGWFELAAELDSAGISELHTNRDGVVRVRDEISGIKAVLAASEVRKLRRRVMDRQAEIAAEGRPSGARPFGYRRAIDETGRKTLLIVPEQAAIVREIAEKILSGWSLTGIANELTAAGVTGARGGTITVSTIHKMVTSPAIAGQRMYQGRVIGPAVWPAILDLDTWHAVRTRLAAPRVVKRVDGRTYPLSAEPRSTARRYLLTGGTAVCGVCGAALVATVTKKRRANGYKPEYLCRAKSGGKSCVGITGDPFEADVVCRLLAELDKPDFREALAHDQHAAQRDQITTALRALDGQRNDLAAMWAAQELTAEEWRTARRALAEHEQQLRGELAAVPAAVSHVDPTLIIDGWLAMNLDERREIIGMFIERVVVGRAKPGTRAYDSGRVAVEWRKR